MNQCKSLILSGLICLTLLSLSWAETPVEGPTVFSQTDNPAAEIQKSEPPPSSVSFSIVGDIMVHSWQLKTAYRPQDDLYDFTAVFSPVKELLSAADFTVGNLETTLPGDQKEYAGYPLFGAPDALVTALKAAGFKLLTTANNHCLDKGKKGLERTIKTLDQQGLLHLGTYVSREEYESRRPLVLEKNGITMALLAYTYGTNGIPPPPGVVVDLIDKCQIACDLASAREKRPDIIMVFFHFGEEYQRTPNDFQKELAALAFWEGADIIVGSHPHVLQPFELKEIPDKFGITKPRLAAYSLGNFVSSQPWRYTDGGIIFNFTLSRDPSAGAVRIEKINYVPVWVYVERKAPQSQFYVLPAEQYLKNDQPIKLPPAEYQKMMQFYEDTKTHLGTNK